MRVVHATLDGNLPRYGIGLAVVRIVGALARGGDAVVLACRAGCAEEVPATEGVTVVPLERRRGLFGGRRAYVRQVARAAAALRAEVVHVHGATRLADWLVRARGTLGVPVVVTCHSSAELGPSASASGEATPARAKRHAAALERVLARADGVAAPSRWMAARVAERARASGTERDVEVMPLGPTDGDAASPPAREEPAGFTVLALARLTPVKGLDVLVDAFALAFADDPRARLVLAGEGPERESLERRAFAAGIASRVRFPGYVTDEARRRAFAAAHVVAVPTRGDYETFGLTALDASAAGVAVVVSDGGALPERVEHGEGVVVPEGDVEALAGALRALRDDADRRRTMGERGREGAVDRWSWARSANAHRTWYEGVRSRAAGR